VSLAKVVLSGLVDSDPEKRFTSNQNMAVTTFNMWVPALPRQGQASATAEQDGFVIKVTCWRQLAEVVAETVRKGEAILVEGKLMVQSFQTPEGAAKKGFEIELNSLDKLSGLPQSISANQGAGSASTNSGSSQPSYSNSQSTHPPQQPAMASAGNHNAGSSFSSEDFLTGTEDDIPF
jgi:single-strand DNA-binding protein